MALYDDFMQVDRYSMLWAILTFLLSYRSYDLLEHCLPSKTRTKTRITYCSCFKTDTSYDQIGQYDKIYGFEIYQTMMNNILGKIQNLICKEIMRTAST